MNTIAADPDALVQTGADLFQRGQFDAAASSARRALKARPAHIGALNLLAVSLNALGEYAKASQCFTDLTRREPKNPNHWMNLGTALQADQRHPESLTAYAQAGALGESSADFYYNVGLVHLAMGNFEAAHVVLRDAVRLAPADAEIHYQLAVCCDEMMRPDEASAALEGWQGLRGLTTDLLAKIGMLLMKLGELQGAGRAVAMAARDPQPGSEAMLRMIQVQERVNLVSEARAGLTRLKQRPDLKTLGDDLVMVEARLADREGRIQEACDLYVELLRNCPEEHLRHHHLFPLAKALDALGRFDEAFTALEQAHRSQVAYLKLAAPNSPAWRRPAFRIADFGTDAADVASWDMTGAPGAEESPIFIVGFPRSGTTLLEQMLDAHPLLASMDETRFLHEVIDRVTGDGVVYPEKLAAMSRARLDEMRSLYWSRVRTKIELAPGERLVDKNPLNLLALPAIRRLFPNSRILLAIRHPCDVILSCYMQHFRAPDFTLMCRDLPSLATGYLRAFDSWYREAAILEPAVLDVRYETFVGDFESQARSIAGFLGLDWTDRMLEPAKHAMSKGFISTPSYSQVVQPVHTRSVGRWKSYDRHFGAVISRVQPYLDRWGYAE